MKTNLIGKSNAVLISDGEFIAIIGCGAKADITKKLELAIKEHFVASKVTVEPSDELDNQKPVSFTAEIITEDEEVEYRDFEIFITATY
jgi:diacylglycerol kinase family enzyme